MYIISHLWLYIINANCISSRRGVYAVSFPWDLSTTLEMTVLGRVFSQGRTTFPGDSSLRSEWQDHFLFRHFDQVKRVEKSPKAKQWLPHYLRFVLVRFNCLAFSLHLINLVFSNDTTFLLHSIYPYFPQITKQFGNPTLCFLPNLPTLSSHCFYSLSFYLSLL